jgi:site-specific recombinase XerC
MQSARYPDYLMSVAGSSHADQSPPRSGPGSCAAQSRQHYERFCAWREEMLVNYGYNTARAYWSDLEGWRDWCCDEEPTVDALEPSPNDIVRYLRELIESGYSPNTVARRLTALRLFFDIRDMGHNPARLVPPIPRR